MDVREGKPDALVEFMDRRLKEIDLGACTLRVDVESVDDRIVGLTLVNKKTREQIDLIEGIPKNIAVIERKRGHFKPSNDSSGYEYKIYTPDLERDGGRLVFLHEKAHSKRITLHQESEKYRIEFNRYKDGKIILDPSTENLVKVACAEPAAHGSDEIEKRYVHIPKYVVKGYLETRMRNEVESWEEALIEYTRLRNDGFDLEPNLTDEEIEGVVYEGLSSYQDVIDSMEIRNYIDIPELKIPRELAS